MDEEAAERALSMEDAFGAVESVEPSGPPLTEWSLEAQQLAMIIELLQQQMNVDIAIASQGKGNTSNAVRPFPRPVTALDDARARRSAEAQERTRARFSPRE